MCTVEVCRLCLVQTTIYSSLLESKTAKMLEALTSIKTNSNENISNVICLKCQLNLKLAYNIQQNMIKANEILEQRLTVKKEFDVIIKNEKLDDNMVPLCNNYCIICGLTITTNSLNNHIKHHFNEEKQSCESCGESFFNIQNYRQHLIKHPDRQLHQCNKCGIRFHYKSFYQIHLQMVHKAKKILISKLLPKPVAYSCDICPKTFQSKAVYLVHKSNHKKKECPICHKELARGSFRQHMSDHNDNPQICEICGATLKNKSCLRMHMYYSHNGSTFKCEDCGKVFKKKNSCNFHRRSEHGIGEPTHVCDTCGKKFYSSNRLNIHMRMTHMKLRPFICDFCKKGFSSKFALTTHRRQHTNETPYKCEVCGEGFRQNVSLKGHRKSKHNIIEPMTCECKVCGKGFASDWALKTHQRLH